MINEHNIRGNNMTDTSIITETVDIPVAKKSYLETKISKINHKAQKMGCDPLILYFDNEHTYSYNIDPYTGAELAFPRHMDMVTATLVYQIPIIEGYELIAKLDIYPTADGNSEVMVSAVPGKEVPEVYKNKTEIHCDHCGWNRRRNHSVLLRNIEDGTYKEVGSTCVKDFFGIDPKGFMLMAGIKFDALIGAIDEDAKYSAEYRTAGGYNLIEVFAVSAAAIAKWGWLSKGKAWELNNNYNGGYVATAEHVLDNLNRDGAYYNQLDDSLKVSIEQEDIELAKKTLAYFTDLDPNGNDYLNNCCKLIRIGYVPYKHIGIACSMVQAYNREVEKQAKAEAAKAEAETAGMKPSEHQGTLKERLRDIAVTVTYARTFEKEWGETTLYAFKDAFGNIYKTWYSGGNWSCEVGEKLLITGTVKKHGEFNGVKETLLNRVAVKDAPEETFSADEFKVN